MPPKSGSRATAGGKTLQKDKQKVIEDKTFGMKNKNKSKKVEKYVQQLEHNITQGARKRMDGEIPVKQKKKEEQKMKEELAQLFKPVQVTTQKVAAGVDPKSVLCVFFKSGQCTKGKNCKFSHDLDIERKTEKIDLYTDVRGEDDERLRDTMDTWDQEKLETVVASKDHMHGQRCKSDIVCRHFLEAIERRQYGWFWECPNGGEKCQYRHALPAGYILKTEKKEIEDEKEEITFEEFLEIERHKLPGPLTPITEASFNAWKQERKRRQEQEELELQKKKETDYKSGVHRSITGRDLFVFQPELFIDDEAAMGEYQYENGTEQDHLDNETEYREDSFEVESYSSGSSESLENSSFNETNDPLASGHLKNTNLQDDVVFDESLFNEEDLDQLNIDD